MKYPKFILISTLCITLVIGIWAGIFVFKGVNWGSRSVSPTPSLSPSPTTSARPSVSPSETSAGSALQKCIDAEKKKTGSTQYERGSLLVSFQSTVGLSGAKKILEKNGLGYENSADLESNYRTNPWLTAKVTKGEEFKWICVLKGESGVKGAIVNAILELHE